MSGAQFEIRVDGAPRHLSRPNGLRDGGCAETLPRLQARVSVPLKPARAASDRACTRTGLTIRSNGGWEIGRRPAES
jgi:hypothetical protein